MNLSEITEVWTPTSAILAIVAGIAYGLLVGWIATDPNYSAGIASAARLAVIAFVFAASAGLIFFALQTLGTYLSGDPNWPRVMSRYGQWVVFSLAIAVTTWVLVERDRHRRRARAHDRAIEIEGGEQS